MQRKLVVLCVGFVFTFPVITYANLITNPSFETPVVNNTSKFQYYYANDPIITGWTIIGDSVDILMNKWVPHQGSQSLDLTGVQAGGVFQNINTVAGQVYQLSFWLSGNPELAGGAGGPATKSMKLSWGVNSVATLNFNVTGHTVDNLGWEEHDYQLTATGSTMKLQFESLTTGSAGALIDDVNLVQIPEPVSAMTLAATTAAGLLLSRRSRRVARREGL